MEIKEKNPTSHECVVTAARMSVSMRKELAAKVYSEITGKPITVDELDNVRKAMAHIDNFRTGRALSGVRKYRTLQHAKEIISKRRKQEEDERIAETEQ
jgi:hypothetical protein